MYQWVIDSKEVRSIMVLEGKFGTASSGFQIASYGQNPQNCTVLNSKREHGNQEFLFSVDCPDSGGCISCVRTAQ
jgi:hypothetical protein